MKRMIMAVLTASALISCADKYNVKLKDGSIVKAIDMQSRNYKAGDTVCIDYPDSYSMIWEISANGRMIDTSYYIPPIDSNKYGIMVIKKIGVIK